MDLMLRRRAIMGRQKLTHGTWEDLFRSIDAKTYAGEYMLGELIPLDLGAGGKLNMEIIAFDADAISDGSGNAPVTLLSKELYQYKLRFNPEYVAGQIGTGTIGGFENCELRNYLRNTILTKFPALVQSRILSVDKYTLMYDENGELVRNALSSETIWIPSGREVTNNASYETTGVGYPYLSSNAKRIKARVGYNPSDWELRSAYSTSRIYNVGSNGSPYTTSKVSSGYGVSFGICVG